MTTKSSARVELIFRALLVDECTTQRTELSQSGVSDRRIQNLYPYDRAALTAGLDAYMSEGKRIALKQPFETSQVISERSLDAYKLLSNDQITAAGKWFNDHWELSTAAVDAIAAYPAATFNKVDGTTGFSGSHESQASDLVTRLNWALLYARDSSDTELGATYLESLVDTYLPDLLGDHEAAQPKPEVPSNWWHFWRR